MVGFRLSWNFYVYTIVLLLMSCISASVNILLGMVVNSIMTGILCATILMMHLILLTPIFVNFGEYERRGVVVEVVVVVAVVVVVVRVYADALYLFLFLCSNFNRHHETVVP